MIFTENLFCIKKHIVDQRYTKYVLSMLLHEASVMYNWGYGDKNGIKVWNTKKEKNGNVVHVVQPDTNSVISMIQTLFSLYYYRGLAIRNERLIGNVSNYITYSQKLFNDPNKAKIKFIIHKVKYDLDEVKKEAALHLQKRCKETNIQLNILERIRNLEIKKYGISYITDRKLVGLNNNTNDILQFLTDKNKAENNSVEFLNTFEKLGIAKRYMSTNKVKIINFIL